MKKCEGRSIALKLEKSRSTMQKKQFENKLRLSRELKINGLTDASQVLML